MSSSAGAALQETGTLVEEFGRQAGSANRKFHAPMDDHLDITHLLLKWSGGDREAFDRLLPVLYEQLRNAAHNRLVLERRDHTLNTTALVHEAYLKLVDGRRVQFKDRSHFLAIASRAMRHILVDYARRKNAAKRAGGMQRVPLDDERLLPQESIEPLLELDEALQLLETRHPRAAMVIEHTYFGGLIAEETAQVLGVSVATAERDLRFGRTYLASVLDDTGHRAFDRSGAAADVTTPTSTHSSTPTSTPTSKPTSTPSAPRP